MTASEYVAAFASIILALAVTDLATSMHRLLRARARVRWHWLALTIAGSIATLPAPELVGGDGLEPPTLSV